MRETKAESKSEGLLPECGMSERVQTKRPKKALVRAKRGGEGLQAKELMWSGW